MSDDSLLSWNQCTQDDCDMGCGLGRLRIVFDEGRYLLATWSRLYVQSTESYTVSTMKPVK